MTTLHSYATGTEVSQQITVKYMTQENVVAPAPIYGSKRSPPQTYTQP